MRVQVHREELELAERAQVAGEDALERRRAARARKQWALSTGARERARARARADARTPRLTEYACVCARFAGGSTIAVSISPIMRALRARGVALSRSHMPVPPSASGSDDGGGGGSGASFFAPGGS